MDSIKIFLSYYKGLIESEDHQKKSKIAESFVNYINYNLKQRSYPEFLTEPSETEEVSKTCYDNFSAVYKDGVVAARRDYFLKNRCEVIFFDDFANNVFDPSVLSIMEGSENMLPSKIYSNSKYYIGKYNENISTAIDCRQEYRRLISRFFQDNFSEEAISKIDVKGCEDVENILKSMKIDEVDINEVVAVCKLNGEGYAQKSLDGAFSFVASRLLSKPADFLMDKKYAQKIFDLINFENFEFTAKIIGAGYYFFTGIPGLVLSSNIPAAILRKIAFMIAANKAYEYSKCIAFKLGEEAKTLSEAEKRKIYRAVIVIVYGVEMGNSNERIITIMGKEYDTTQAETNINNAYNDLAEYIEDQLSNPNKNEKYYNCIV